jgi:hypothetical protein
MTEPTKPTLLITVISCAEGGHQEKRFLLKDDNGVVTCGYCNEQVPDDDRMFYCIDPEITGVVVKGFVE